MELLLEYAANFQDSFKLKESLPSSVTLSQFTACFLLPWVISPGVTSTKITFYKSRSNILSYGLITILVFGATALATASLLYVSDFTCCIFDFGGNHIINAFICCIRCHIR
jgi:hypothetical protein